MDKDHIDEVVFNIVDNIAISISKNKVVSVKYGDSFIGFSLGDEEYIPSDLNLLPDSVVSEIEASFSEEGMDTTRKALDVAQDTVFGKVINHIAQVE